MTAYDETCKVEDRGKDILEPYMRSLGWEIRPIEGKRQFQKHGGDYIVNTPNGMKLLETKTEQTNRHKNLYLESWSNKPWNTRGWLYTSEADLLWYYFLRECELYTVDLPELQAWAFERGNIDRFDEKEQKKYEQLNQSWGRCVPIVVLKKEVDSFTGPINPTAVLAV